MKKTNNVLWITGFFLMLILFNSCSSAPEPIRLGQDSCSFCKMSIADENFGGEIITKKGKVFKFDDMHCIQGFLKSKALKTTDIKNIWLINFDRPHNFIAAEKAFLLKSEDLHSPMGGNIAAFESSEKLNSAMKNIKGEIVYWNNLANEK